MQAKTGRLPIIYAPAVMVERLYRQSTAFGHTPVWVPDHQQLRQPAAASGLDDLVLVAVRQHAGR